MKFIGLVVLGAGLGASLLSRSAADRMWAACWLTSAGMMLTWCAGYGLVGAAGHSVLSPFIVIGVALSLLGHLDALLYARRPSALSAALTCGGMTGAVAAMTLRPTDTADLGLVVAAVLVGGVLGGIALGRREAAMPSEEGAPIIVRWFVWIARLEGLSLLTLMLVIMPMKRLMGLSDGGWTGWIHGALFMQYGLALLMIARAKSWSMGRIVAAFFAALLPGGTFAFELLSDPSA